MSHYLANICKLYQVLVQLPCIFAPVTFKELDYVVDLHWCFFLDLW